MAYGNYRNGYKKYRRTSYMGKKKSYASKKINKYKAKRMSTDTVRRIAKKEVSRLAENKTVQFFSTGSNIYPSSAGVTFTSSILPLSPYTSGLQIIQGTGQGDRIGNNIRIKNLYFKGTIYPLPYNATTNPTPVPTQIVFWIFYARQEPTTIPSSIAGFLQDGSVSRNLSGNLSDLISRVNNDQYRLLTRRVFKIGHSGYANTGRQPNFQDFWNNDFKLNQNFNINLTKYAVKNVRFNDSSSTPRTRGIFLLAQCIGADGSTIANNHVMTRMTYEISCTYEDM